MPGISDGRDISHTSKNDIQFNYVRLYFLETFFVFNGLGVLFINLNYPIKTILKRLVSGSLKRRQRLKLSLRISERRLSFK